MVVVNIIHGLFYMIWHCKRKSLHIAQSALQIETWHINGTVHYQQAQKQCSQNLFVNVSTHMCVTISINTFYKPIAKRICYICVSCLCHAIIYKRGEGSFSRIGFYGVRKNLYYRILCRENRNFFLSEFSTTYFFLYISANKSGLNFFQGCIHA